MTSVTGQVVFEPEAPTFDTAVLTVKLEDVGLAGVPSTVIATFSRDVQADDVDSLDFELTVDDDSQNINPRSTYAVSAHVSLHPNDDPSDIRQGDYLTMQSYPVLTQGHPSKLRVKIQRIG